MRRVRPPGPAGFDAARHAGPRAAVLPRWTYVHIHDDVLPALRARGVTEEQIATMLIDNPRRYFGGSSYAGRESNPHRSA